MKNDALFQENFPFS